MTQAEVRQLAQTFAMYAAYYRVSLNDEILAMYADDLADLDLSSVRQALDEYRKNPKNRIMPLPAMIRERLQPQVDPESQSREIAARISGAVVKFGHPGADQAREFIGEVGWRIVETRGGWSHLCQNLGVTIDLTAFEAQVREQAKASVKYGAPAMQLAICPGVKRGELQPVGDIMKLITAKKEGL